MGHVLNKNKKMDTLRRIPVLRLEIDYELATLYEAMQANNKQKITECKRKLEILRLEMLRLGA